MKNFFPLVLAALLGTASCGNMCFEKAKSLCLLQVMAKHSNDFICGGNKEYAKCLETGARQCNFQSNNFVQDMLHTYKATCTEGTELNTLFKKYGECSFQGADDGNTLCMNPVKEELKKKQISISRHLKKTSLEQLANTKIV
ncbi:hypothetical protein CDAR_32531 [Caerostris darwini]|uniref:Uncharacterized protein n=1 Tax=Caerostris darwini TaxID=1538125 RepID=A0AAV4WQ09_9ARAC|nr:hypothetical protein CDAR_32531 [Caerostris darwini]